MWKRSPKRDAITRVRVDDRRNSSIVLDLQVRRKGVSCRRQLGTRSDSLLEVERIKLVWVQREDRQEGGVAQRGKSGARSGEPEHAAREGGSRKKVRRMFKMLREVWLNIGVEKIDTHEGVVIKVLLDSGAMGMFMDRQTAARHGFKLQKLERPLVIRNVDGTNNSGEAIMH